MTRKMMPADQICAGVRVVPPKLSRLVEVIDYWDNGGQVEVCYVGPSGRGVFIISRYDEIEMECKS